MNETAIPMLPCSDLGETLAFYRILGFTVTYEQTKPYIYGALRRGDFELHFYSPPNGINAADLQSRCLIMVDEVAEYHATFTSALRGHYGKVLVKGNPRITRFRPGQSRFTVYDPAGTAVIFVQRDEPQKLEYGGSAELAGLARVIDSARILRDFKNDDKAAARILIVGLARFGKTAPPVDQARALAALVELAVAMEEPERATELQARLREVDLSAADKALIADDLRATEALRGWEGTGETGPDSR